MNNFPYSNAVELLNTFTGVEKSELSSIFQFSRDKKIIDVELHAVGNHNTTAKYTDEKHPWYQVNNILKVKTIDGYEAISGVDTYNVKGFNEDHFCQLNALIPEILKLTTLDPVEVFNILTQKQNDLSNEVLASIDIMLWDLAAKKAKLPLHKLLGSRRKKIEAYASLPFYETLSEYIDVIHEYAQNGFKVYKYHVWGKLENDKRLIAAVNDNFANSEYKFMIDFENAYNFDEALEIIKFANSDLFILFEGLIQDELFEQSTKLKSYSPMMIIPAGYHHYSPDFIQKAIENDAWDAGRFDVTVIGGLSRALELMIIAEKAKLPIEIQSWGHTLSQSINLHLMLSNNRTTYFEAPMPKDNFEFGMINGNLIQDNMAILPDQPGLGIKVNWKELKSADFYRSSNKEFM